MMMTCLPSAPITPLLDNVSSDSRADMMAWDSAKRCDLDNHDYKYITLIILVIGVSI